MRSIIAIHLALAAIFLVRVMLVIGVAWAGFALFVPLAALGGGTFAAVVIGLLVLNTIVALRRAP